MTDEAQPAPSEDEAAPAEGAEQGSDWVRIDRRTAMKAALGGAAAAAVWSAPRIEGLSTAPDFAQAASCNNGSLALVNANSNNCGYYGDTECFANNCCGNANYGGTVPNSKGVVVNGSWGGDVSGDNGIVNFSVSGIDPPFIRCTINVAGNCNNAQFRTNNSNSNNTSFTQVFNGNGNGSTLIDCQGGGGFVSSDTDANLRVNVSCVCT